MGRDRWTRLRYIKLFVEPSWEVITWIETLSKTLTISDCQRIPILVKKWRSFIHIFKKSQSLMFNRYPISHNPCKAKEPLSAIANRTVLWLPLDPEYLTWPKRIQSLVKNWLKKTKSLPLKMLMQRKGWNPNRKTNRLKEAKVREAQVRH